jgi:MoxR-like ATPase
VSRDRDTPIWRFRTQTTNTRVLDAIEEAVIADRAFFETVLLGILAQSHVLMEDVSDTGKTLTARSIATVLGLSFTRVQFTPDLLPADITGTHMFNLLAASSSLPTT